MEGYLPSPIDIRVDDTTGSDIRDLLADHLRCMHRQSPPESIHALDADDMNDPNITFWSAWEGGELVGCVALKHISEVQVELKSLKTSSKHLRKGVASKLMDHVLRIARERRYEDISLETGSQQTFEPCRRLYEKFGFTYCPPFANYETDPNSVFMTRTLQG